MSFRNIMAGTASLSLAKAMRLLAQFVAIPILARLLTPEDYGLVAIALPFVFFAMMLADAGIGMSLVRVSLVNRAIWSTAFWLSIALGIVLAALMALLGPLAANLFKQPELAPMLLALAAVVLAQAIHLIPVTALQQQGRLGTVAAAETIAIFTGIATCVTMACNNYGAWALIGQQVAFFVVRVVLVCVLSPFRPALLFRYAEIREHIPFSRDVLAGNIVTYASRNFDPWIIGKILGLASAGLYNMAMQFARLPAMLVSGPLQFALYAPFARHQNDSTTIGHAFLAATRILALLVFPAMGMIAIAHAPIFHILLSEKWAIAGDVFMLTAPAAALQTVAAIGTTVLYALGRSTLQLRASAEYTLVWVIALVAAAQFGLTAAALAFTLCGIAYHFRYLSLILPLLGQTMRTYFATYTTPLLSTVSAMALYALIEASVTLTHWQAVFLSAGLTVAAISLAAWHDRNNLRAARHHLSRASSAPAESSADPANAVPPVGTA